MKPSQLLLLLGTVSEAFPGNVAQTINSEICRILSAKLATYTIQQGSRSDPLPTAEDSQMLDKYVLRIRMSRQVGKVQKIMREALENLHVSVRNLQVRCVPAVG